MPDGLHTHYDVTVEVLSPMHIGDGSELLREIDYVTQGGCTWVVDQNALLERTLGSGDRFDDALLGRPISELLQSEDYTSGEVFRYRMPGVPTNRPLRSHIKDVYGRPYLPGSTLKGLLRTMFIWGCYASRRESPDLRYLGKSRSWAGQPVEREVMGGNPNEDLFRAVHVSDSEPVDLDRMRVASVSIYPTGKQDRVGVVVDVEAVREETVFTSRLSIEEYGFTNAEAARQLGWEGKRELLDQLTRFGKVFSARRLAQEIKYYQDKQGPKAVLNFYSRLVQIHESLAKGQFLAQIGWGAGWNSKTLNDLITVDENRFASLVREYRLSRFSQRYSPGDLFPNSRHIALRPMGWVTVGLR